MLISNCIYSQVNTFNGVVALFMKELGVNNRDSLSMTYAVDKLGRALVSRGSKEECSRIAASLSILKTEIVPTIIAQHQQCSVFLLSTLLNICTQTPGLQKLCAMVGYRYSRSIKYFEGIYKYIYIYAYILFDLFKFKTNQHL